MLITNCRTCGQSVELKEIGEDYYYYCEQCNKTYKTTSSFDVKSVVEGNEMAKNKKNKNKFKPVNTNVAYERGASTISRGWDSEIEYIKACDKSPKSIDIFIKPLVKMKIDALMEKFPNIEWLVYLLGEDNVVSDVFIPTQTISAASVDNIECPEWNTLNVIGVMHSHHGMSNNFSGTDDEWINKNHDISLCISNSGINGQVRWKTPCGSMKIVDANVKLSYDIDFDKEGFFKIVDEKINKYTYTPPAFARGSVSVNGIPNYPHSTYPYNQVSVNKINERNENRGLGFTVKDSRIIKGVSVDHITAQEIQDEIDNMDFEDTDTLQDALNTLEKNFDV